MYIKKNFKKITIPIENKKAENDYINNLNIVKNDFNNKINNELSINKINENLIDDKSIDDDSNIFLDIYKYFPNTLVIDNSNNQESLNSSFENNILFLNINKENFLDFILNINNDNKNILIINKSNLVNYLNLQKNSFIELFESIDGVINLSLNLNNIEDFYNIINQPIGFNIDNNNNINFNCCYLNNLLIQKIKNYKLIKNFFTYNFTRPLFCDKNFLIKNLWKKYYKVVNFWDQIYCINLNIDFAKRIKMLKYCNLLNSTENNFFYDGILGLNCPSLNKLIEMNLYKLNYKNHNWKKGEIGLNITQKNIITEAYKKKFKYILVLEDDISFDSTYFNILEYFLYKHKFDILYFGFGFNNHNFIASYNVIDEYLEHRLIQPNINNNLNPDYIFQAGFYAVLLSNKAINILYNEMNPISTISDVLLKNICFNVKDNEKETVKYNYDLNSMLIYRHIQNDIFGYGLFKADKNKLSLSAHLENITNICKSNLKYLRKIKILHFKMNYNHTLKIYISPSSKLYYSNIINLILINFKNYIITNEINDLIDIMILSIEDNLDNLSNDTLNILFIFEPEINIRDNYDLVISSSLYNFYQYNYNLYIPFTFVSLWEQRQNYKIIKKNSRNKFCAYLYFHEINYRKELFKFITQYKQVDALGRCCNNCNIEIDRHTYNNDKTYNDLAIDKYSNYKFVLALENNISYGYATEKIINPIIAGSIPIYAGDTHIFNYINKKRVIYIYDFENYDLMLEYIKKVDNNDDLYNSIVSEPIFCGDINWDNFAEILAMDIKKGLGLESRNVIISKEYKSYLSTVNKYDYQLIFDYSNIPSKYLKRYFNDLFFETDNLIFTD